MYVCSRAFLLLTRFWRSRERLCMSRVRSLLSMRCMLPGYNFEPRLKCLASVRSRRYLGFSRYRGLNYNHRFLSLNGCLHRKKRVWRKKARLTNPEVRAAAASKCWRDSGRASFSPPQWRKRKKGGSTRRVNIDQLHKLHKFNSR